MKRWGYPFDFPNVFRAKFEEYGRYFDNAKREVCYYGAESKYDYIKPVYFGDLSQLCQRIKKTPLNEKWMIFVSSKKVGHDIQERLLALGIESTMITADSKKKHCGKSGKGSKEFLVYQEIVEKEQSPVRVTISTSVLDNGINIKDDNLKHMAILEMNPTSFLQMLGRKRITQADKSMGGKVDRQLNLYILKKDLRELKGYFCQTILKYAKFLAELSYIFWEAGNVSPENTDEQNRWHRFCQNAYAVSYEYQVNGIFKNEYIPYVKNTQLAKTWNTKDHIDNRLKGLQKTSVTAILYEPNPYTATRLAYDYYRMLALLEKYENLPEGEKASAKERLWIEHQLSWLGLSYDPACWIDYKEHIASRKRLDILLRNNEGKAMSKRAQKKIRRTIHSIVVTSHPPMAVKLGKASLSKVNEVLQELGCSKRIISKNKSIKGVQRNYWIIVPNPVE